MLHSHQHQLYHKQPGKVESLLAIMEGVRVEEPVFQSVAKTGSTGGLPSIRTPYKEDRPPETHSAGPKVVAGWATMLTRLLFRQNSDKTGSKSRPSRLVSSIEAHSRMSR